MEEGVAAHLQTLDRVSLQLQTIGEYLLGLADANRHLFRAQGDCERALARPRVAQAQFLAAGLVEEVAALRRKLDESACAAQRTDQQIDVLKRLLGLRALALNDADQVEMETRTGRTLRATLDRHSLIVAEDDGLELALPPRAGEGDAQRWMAVHSVLLDANLHSKFRPSPPRG